MTVVAFPTRADLAQWLGVPDPGTPGDAWDIALSAAREQQTARCVMAPYSWSLHAAALRRAARILAAKGFTLGAVDAGDMPMYLPRWDVEIETYENDARLGPIA